MEFTLTVIHVTEIYNHFFVGSRNNVYISNDPNKMSEAIFNSNSYICHYFLVKHMENNYFKTYYISFYKVHKNISSWF